MVHRLSIVILGLSLAACGSDRLSGEGGSSTGSGDEIGSSESSGAGSSSSGSTSESSESESTETTDTMPEACPVEPALGSYEVLLDGHAEVTDYGVDVETMLWTHTCAVTSHAGTLAAGETIVLSCTDENAQPVEHTIELLTLVEGAPDQAPVALGQQVELSLWVGVWYEFGTVAWTLRDTDQDLLLLYFDGPYLPAPSEEYAPPPEYLAPLVVDVNHEVCPWIVVGVETTGSFVPFEDCYRRNTALRLDLGSGVAEVQSGSAGAIPGGGHAIVETSLDNDYSNCGWVGGTATDYAFTVVGG